MKVGDLAPRFPADRTGVAIVGPGSIATTAHMPAYIKYGIGVVGVWGRDIDRTEAWAAQFDTISTVYASYDELLDDPSVRIVDITTGPESRTELIRQAVAAGKHVLAQKPLASTPAMIADLEAVQRQAAAGGVEVAVNQNGRWAPPWRATTELLRQGAIGEVFAITHLHNKPLPPLVGTDFDNVEHMLVTDYLNHWIDISLTWLVAAGHSSSQPMRVWAIDSRTLDQPADARNPWAATVHITTQSGMSVTIRLPGHGRVRSPGCPFWVHGDAGTINGSVLFESDFVEVDREADLEATPIELGGQWFVDGFAATMGELMLAIDERRRPENSLASALVTARVSMAALASAIDGGRPVTVESAGDDEPT